MTTPDTDEIAGPMNTDTFAALQHWLLFTSVDAKPGMWRSIGATLSDEQRVALRSVRDAAHAGGVHDPAARRFNEVLGVQTEIVTSRHGGASRVVRRET
jgi:hypothetical protein